MRWDYSCEDPHCDARGFRVKELLQDIHISGEEKRLWPVIAAGQEVVWVRGLGVRRDFQAKKGTGVLIHESPLRK